MKECGTPNVPSFLSLRKLQAKLTSEMGMTSTRHVSALGNEFYNNGAAQTYRLDWANPLVRPHIRPYVEVSSSVSEFYQAQRLHDEDVDLLQLMWANFTNAPDMHFYIKEVARMRNGSFVIPIKWVCAIDESRVETECADVYLVDYNPLTGDARVRNTEVIRIRASDLELDFLSLQSQGMQFTFDDKSPSWTCNMPHPVRERAEGRPTFTLGIMNWADDVSGNQSKQYNPHTNVYSANLNLPHRKLQQEFFIHFSSTSPTAGALEQLDGLLTDAGPAIWHEAFDCLLQREILFRLISRVDPADNPQQSELCSHIGLHGNKFCRRCHVGGTAKEMESHDGYESLFSIGTLRTAEDTIKEITNQFIAATHGNETNVEKMQTNSGVKDSISQVWIEQMIKQARLLHHARITNPETQDMWLKDRKLKGDERRAVRNEIIRGIEAEIMKWLTTQPQHRYDSLPLDSPLRDKLRPGDHYNILLGCAFTQGLDVHRDTLVELLHTYLLGLDKYVWHISHTSWDDSQRELMAVRLQNSSVDGLSIYPVRGHYMMKYRNNLIGKHFKTLQQVGVFHLHPDLLEQVHGTHLLELWKATGELGALLFYHTISDISTYLEDVKILIDNLLDIWSVIDPNRIIVKPKLHILQHIVDDIRNCGPAILFSTEIFECWNSIFRMCSVLSNHHAPSRDIAAALLDLERFKHQVSGGWWRSGDGTYVCAGDGVTGMFATNNAMQRRLGWHDDKAQPAGTLLRHSHAKRTIVPWESVLESISAGQEGVSITVDRTIPSQSPGTRWEYAKGFIAQSGDLCKEESWVFYEGPSTTLLASDNGRSVYAGRIQHIFVEDSMSSTKITGVAQIERFAISDCADSRLNMPVLFRDLGRQALHMVPIQNVRFIFNAQHDCLTAECTVSDETVHQQKEQIRLTQRTIRHGVMQRYFINMHAIHNAALIRNTLPRHLSKPKPYFENRTAMHRKFADNVSSTNTKRREVTAAKASETRARKAAEANLA
ncbi:hypothetical protein BDY19DRAFT_1017745 [Irpex rosettiformis]|uniref:Uncharacterized protein n=1 Tax=Irpex rosettiformis TaxID=378272 RepID=A0ACB8TW99_9APHY|nr:hypothetical protein BDY19DRAFT_1017745 [Irpex rosettiformis]